MAIRPKDTKDTYHTHRSPGYKQWVPLLAWYFENSASSKTDDTDESKESHTQKLSKLTDGLAKLDAFSMAKAGSPSRRQAILFGKKELVQAMDTWKIEHQEQNNAFVNQAFLSLFQTCDQSDHESINILGTKWDEIKKARTTAGVAQLTSDIEETDSYKQYRENINAREAARIAEQRAAARIHDGRGLTKEELETMCIDLDDETQTRQIRKEAKEAQAAVLIQKRFLSYLSRMQNRKADTLPTHQTTDQETDQAAVTGTLKKKGTTYCALPIARTSSLDQSGGIGNMKL